MKPTDSGKTQREPAGAPASNFIRAKVARDLAGNRHGGRVHTRFPPEPNGHLHIGHAKSICLNFGIAREHGGLCNLRFDDTNPLAESREYVDAIKDGIRWLGFRWHGPARHSSAYFERLYGFARQLIEKGHAFVCGLSAAQARERRGTLVEPGRDSPDRGRPARESLELFERMRGGEFADGACTLRARIDMASPNINMRDPVLYRIRHAGHHQTGDAWCIYPTYDYAHCVSDALEGITHSLCTLEFEDHRPLYDWILRHLDLESLRAAGDLADGDGPYELPEQTEFARLRLNYTVMSKRSLGRLVESGAVSGWDDPRMPTLAGMRRRGYTPAAIRSFCEAVGISRSESVVDIGMLEHAVRDDLDKTAPRAMCVLDPLKLVISNIEAGREEQLELANHPKDPSMGRRRTPFTRELYIDRADFEEDPPAGFRRLRPGGEVRLRGAYVVRCDSVEKDGAGRVARLHCTADLDTLGRRPAGRKAPGVVHWVSAPRGVPIEARLYDRLFGVENPDAKDIEELLRRLNPDSARIVRGAVAEPSVAAAGAPAAFQFEREGYFRRDEADSSPSRPVFNRTIALKDSWSSRP